MKKLQKTILATAIAGIIAFPAFKTSAQDFSDAQKEQIGSILEQHLKDNPQIVIEAIENFRNNQEALEARKFQENLAGLMNEMTGENVPMAGNPDGTLTIVEFFDYNCGYCKRAMDDVIKVLENEKDVKMYFIELPILSESSREAARFALAAHRQGKYMEYHTALMEHRGTKDTNTLKKIGADLGLDADKLESDAKSQAISDMIANNLRISQELGIRGTPAFIVGDILSPGYMPYEQMKTVIQAARDAQSN